MTVQIAKQDCYGIDGVGVRRFIRAGDQIPPGLDVASEDITVSDGTVTPAAGHPDYDGPADALQAEVERLGLPVEGTGSNGNVVKADLVAALKAHYGD